MPLFRRCFANDNNCNVLALMHIVKSTIEQSRYVRTDASSNLIRVGKCFPYLFKEFWHQIRVSIYNVRLALIG